MNKPGFINGHTIDHYTHYTMPRLGSMIVRIATPSSIYYVATSFYQLFSEQRNPFDSLTGVKLAFFFYFTPNCTDAVRDYWVNDDRLGLT